MHFILQFKYCPLLAILLSSVHTFGEGNLDGKGERSDIHKRHEPFEQLLALIEHNKHSDIAT